MRCSITVEWRDGEEEVEFTRQKEPPEMWVSPVEGGWRAIQQVLNTLDSTYTDLRAALIAAMPKEVQAQTLVVAYLTQEQVRDFTDEGQR